MTAVNPTLGGGSGAVPTGGGGGGTTGVLVSGGGGGGGGGAPRTGVKSPEPDPAPRTVSEPPSPSETVSPSDPWTTRLIVVGVVVIVLVLCLGEILLSTSDRHLAAGWDNNVATGMGILGALATTRAAQAYSSKRRRSGGDL